jgi:hypothetical protein
LEILFSTVMRFWRIRTRWSWGSGESDSDGAKVLEILIWIMVKFGGIWIRWCWGSGGPTSQDAANLDNPDHRSWGSLGSRGSRSEDDVSVLEDSDQNMFSFWGIRIRWYSGSGRPRSDDTGVVVTVSHGTGVLEDLVQMTSKFWRFASKWGWGNWWIWFRLPWSFVEEPEERRESEGGPGAEVEPLGVVHLDPVGGSPQSFTLSSDNSDFHKQIYLNIYESFLF